MATWSLRLRPVWSLAPAAPASSVTRRSTAVWMSSSVGTNSNVPLGQLLLDVVEGGEHRGRLLGRRGARPGARPRTWAREPARSSAREALVEGQAHGEGQQLVGRAVREAAVPERGHRLAAAASPWRAGPGLDAEAPQAHEAGGVLVAEAVGGVVGGEAVVVEAVRAAPAGDLARAGREVQPHLAGDEALASRRRTRRGPA